MTILCLAATFDSRSTVGPGTSSAMSHHFESWLGQK